uniref:Spalt like transcription factor 2 n=1 Tax=Bos indicus x Bos taurus TaxID=30522 RepID=A0A4W2D013_BOBOX
MAHEAGRSSRLGGPCGEPAELGGDVSEDDHPQVCAKCCAQFTDPTEFLAHQNACSTDPPVMVIIGGQENPNNSSTSCEPRPEGHSSPQAMEAEQSNPSDCASSVPTDPTWGPERRGEESSGHFLIAATGRAFSSGLPSRSTCCWPTTRIIWNRSSEEEGVKILLLTDVSDGSSKGVGSRVS